MPGHKKPSGKFGRNVRLVVVYDGTDFAGWQVQPRARTVQRVLLDAIRDITGEKVTLLASGRTDSGVHAAGQVVNFRTGTKIAAERLVTALNSKLPRDVAVLSADDVPLSFHATHDAKSKVYRYRICRRAVRPVLGRRDAYWVRGPLDVPAMRRAARYLVGKHDFNSFRAEGYREKDTVRTIESIRLTVEGDMLDIYFKGDGFLYMMIRIMVGTLVRAGQGKTKPSQVKSMLAARDRRAAGPTAPPHGLCLMQVSY